ncbi:MAG: ABC transporter permease [Actinomycetota bacterium]
MRVALVIAGKELRQRLRDRSAIFVGFLAPSLLATIVTFAFGSGFGDDVSFQIAVAVVDNDRSDISRGFIDVLESDELRQIVLPQRAKSEAVARKLVDDGGVNAAFIVPKGFESAVIAGRKAEITTLTDASSSFTGDIAEAIAQGFTSQVSASRLAVFTTMRASGGDPSTVAALGTEASRERIPVQLVDSGVATRDVSGANYFGPSMAMFFLFFTVGAAARGLLAERAMGTLPRILAAPARRESVMAGKALATFVLGVASMVTVYVVMGVFFGVDWGDPIAIGVLTLLTVGSLMMLTALVQTLAKTEQAAANYASMIGVVLAILGGNFFPLYLLPDLIQKASALTPNGWALRAFTDIAYDGASLLDLGPHIAALLAFTSICGTVAAFRVRRLTVA